MVQQIAVSLIFAYILFGIYIYFMQSKLIYYPDNQDFFQCEGFNDYEKVEYKATRFYYLKQNNDVMIFYHGNAGSACDRSFLKSLFESTGKSLVFVEYAGYSNHKSSPNKKLILQDVENMIGWIKDKNFGQVAVIGESIGAGAASYHASLGKVDSLLLLGSFSSAVRAAPWLYKIYPLRILMTENYDNVEYLQKYPSKILFIHGSKDFIINSKHSRELFDTLDKADREYFLVEGAGHNDLFDFDIDW